MIAVSVRQVALSLAILLGVGVLGYGAYAWSDGHPPFAPADDSWQGVFLTNGQAYFGHFYSGPGEYATLRDVYYVLAQQLQSQDGQTPAQGQQAQTQLSLQQLGGEIHGPEGAMRISKSQILFVENLRKDSPLVASILQFKANPPSSRTPAPATTAPAPAPTAASSPSPARTASPSPR